MIVIYSPVVCNVYCERIEDSIVLELDNNYREKMLICRTAKKEKDPIPSHTLGLVMLKNKVLFQRKHLKGAMMNQVDISSYLGSMPHQRRMKLHFARYLIKVSYN